MKKILAITTSSAMLLSGLVGCTNETNTTEESTIENKTLSVVTTSFSAYDWIRKIGGENIEITYLLDNGIDLHSYEPSVTDIVKIQESDLFIYIGGHSDSWSEDVIDEQINAISLGEILGDRVLNEESVTGSTDSHDDHDEDEHDDHDDDDHDEDEHNDHDDDEHDDHDEDEHDDHDEDEHDDHDHDDHGNNHDDEHVWLSLENAGICTEYLAFELSKLDPQNSTSYITKASDFKQDLLTLKEEYAEKITKSSRDTILVADRFPLRYMVEEFGISYLAAFSGCSSEFEISFETLKLLSDTVVELDLETLLVIDGSAGDIAQTVLDQTTKTADILKINSMQSIVKADLDQSYIDIMRDNLEILLKALN